MRRGEFPVDALPAWCLLNDVTFVDVKVADIEGRGLGLVAERDLVNEEDHYEVPTLLAIPKELVLSAEGVEEYAKENKDFRQLLDAAGHQSTRGDILLFLLTQLVRSSPDYTGGQGAMTPWTQYFSLLPTQVPVPTMWSESELSHLRGTSLESAVSAKFAVLTKEFDAIREKTSEILYWDEILAVDGAVTVRDWVLLDALYRSRSLDLPKSGESMVPCLDLVNHSSSATAYFEENSKDEVVLLLKKGCGVPQSSEITISYGQDKSAAEMLFSYGFIDTNSPAKSIVLPLEPMDDDPLAKAKLHAFGKPPVLEIKDDDSGVPQWSAPFVYLMCLNEEDGLEFKILQATDGSRRLSMFWQETDITDEPYAIPELIGSHELAQIFKLRAVTVILEVVQQQLQELSPGEERSDAIPGLARAEVLQAASHLRAVESDLLKRALQVLDEQRTQLLADDSVLAYLGSMEATNSDQIVPEASNGNEDLS
ncbi:Uu.00g101090.m01.CDS01 [Anthostomella pinea]|uniref:Uu.00g101090.m01.CDS01 n=1 Tax=Anthostomella pinea TaxID=933095 RepID=A0AAI8VD56_9PEZI|nr:Uu.00g101090.m01.CDS01 [Anthostomella pinea]